MEKLQEQGWYLSEQGFNLVSDSGTVKDIQKLIKRALDMDLREIGSGTKDINLGNLVLQIQKLRNVSAPKSNEESRGAPRMLRLYLTDGKNNYQAVELDQLPSITLNTPPGTKILLKSGGAPTSHGIILLKPFNISSVLGGKVPALIEKWELNRKLAVHSRMRSADEGGPPPWIPFGKKIVKITEQDRNFKALADKDAAPKDNSEFEAQRQAAVAEAAKQGSKKVFGGGTKQLLDHSVQKIVDQGFSIEQAEHALKINRNNTDRALKSLQRNENRGNGNREGREPREPRGKRFEKKNEETKPSSGKVSLFDFLEDKLPAQSETVDAVNNQSSDGYSSRLDNHVERFEGRGYDGHSSRGGRGQRSGRGSYQAPPRHSDDSRFSKRNNENYNTNNSHQTRPPRFQRSQDQYHPQEHNPKPPFPKNSYQTNRRNPESSNAPKTFRNHNQSQIHNEPESFNRQTYDSQFQSSHGRYNRGHQDTGHKNYNANTSDNRNNRNQNRYDNNSRGNENNRCENGPWVWKKGDQCLAKYWEDNQYYNAEVTAVSATTCVVQFKDFNNYEEVLQVDCLPITEDLAPSFGEHQRHERPNRSQRHDNFSGGAEFRRGGGGSAGPPGGKGYRKRGPQRSAQPIYQPPAQRSTRENPKI
ncbi:tudor domain-containing protein 3 [Fopius arisanus]|uniref:Tudor domain-containing protein 3 n=1 Tax=Fopius arisanus TaxID=64838 RepID=A0A9R1SUV6_9HYME|nr:PREDICTED: tudor domain-containing protein 3 [Fopius arisanus]